MTSEKVAQMRASSLVTRVDPGQHVRLNDLDPDFTARLKRQDVATVIEQLGERLNSLQELLYAASSHAVLVVLQGMDTSGKDGTIRHVFAHVNPLGCRAYAFKAPTEEEAGHDFLWRVHERAPGHGSLVIFNRSHYEDVLVVRVRGLAPKKVWKQRYEQINQFESLLHSSGTSVIKLFLHVGKDEQKQRLLERENDKDKARKLAVSDWEDRQLWDDFTSAYEDVFRKCSTDDAPWYIVPANKKWFRNFAVATVLVEALEQHAKEWRTKLEAVGRQQLRELTQFRQTEAGRQSM